MPPAAAVTATVRHRVAFYETDAMRIVHHSNYVRYLELARVAWLDQHDRPYRDYMAEDLHFATTRVELHYKLPAAFDDVLDIITWLGWVGGASLRMEYELRRGEELIAHGVSEHAMVDGSGRVRRIPRERRDTLRRSLPEGATP